MAKQKRKHHMRKRQIGGAIRNGSGSFLKKLGRGLLAFVFAVLGIGDAAAAGQFSIHTPTSGTTEGDLCPALPGYSFPMSAVTDDVYVFDPSILGIRGVSTNTLPRPTSSLASLTERSSSMAATA
jgi:hypothetical protein